MRELLGLVRTQRKGWGKELLAPAWAEQVTAEWQGKISAQAKGNTDMELGRRKIKMTATAVQLSTVCLVLYSGQHLGIFQLKGQHRAAQAAPYACC